LVAAIALPATRPALAQYTDGLPAGLREITVDGQPIDAATVPEVATTTPEFAGRLNRGTPPVLELALQTEAGEVIRFAVEVDPESLRFRGQAPDPLAAGRYALYANDALVGEFVVTGEDGTPRARRGGGRPLDLALVIPFPVELSTVNPNLGVARARYFDIEQQALAAAAADGEVTREEIAQRQQELRNGGWRQRYEAVLAEPDPDDDTGRRFATEIIAQVFEYEDAAVAEAAFAQAAGANEPIETDITIGEESQLSEVSGVASQTGAAYRGLRLTFRQDRILVVIRYVDLLNREVDQDTFLSLGQQLQGRAEAVLGEDFQGLSPKALRLDVGPSASSVAIQEAYELIAGAAIRGYREEEAALEARAESYAGAENVYSSTVAAVIGGGAGRRAGPEGTPRATAAGQGSEIGYASVLYGFSDEAAAEEWLAGLDARLQQAQLPGYLSFAAVADAPAYGDGSITYELNRQIGEATAGGFRVYVRVGAEVAAVELAAVDGVSVDAVEELVNAQIECLQRGACQATADVPAGVGPRGGDN